MHKTPYVFPLVGNRNVEHLKRNIEAFSLRLSEDKIQRPKIWESLIWDPGSMIGMGACGSGLNDVVG